MRPVRNSTIGVVIETCGAADIADWTELRTELWPDGSADEHWAEAAAGVGEPERLVAFIARDAEGQSLGFAEASLRFDYVNGCSSSPVGFLEGLYVREPFRRMGITRGLVASVEMWARERGCAELASDVLLINAVSQKTHRALGFAETERVVFFRKSLEAPVTQ